MRVIAAINQKGGVGKTTTVLNTAHALSLLGQRVLAIDLDAQGHLSDSLGVRDRGRPAIDDVLLDQQPIQECITCVRGCMDFIPAGPRLGMFESRYDSATAMARGWRLYRALKTVDGYDFVLIDCPPSTGLLAMNALIACQELLIPVSSDYLSLSGVAKLVAVLDHIEHALAQHNRKWVVMTRYQNRRKLAREVQQKLLEYFPDNLLATVVRENVALAESPGFGTTIFEYQRKSYGAVDYLQLAHDLLHERTMLNDRGGQNGPGVTQVTTRQCV